MIHPRASIFLAGLLWSFGGVFIKSIDLPAPTIAVYRSFFAAVILLPFLTYPPAVWRGETFPSFLRNRHTFTAILSYTGIMASFVTANKLTFAANAIVLQYTAPFFIPLFKILPGFRTKTHLQQDLAQKQNISILFGCAVGIFIILFGQAGTPDLTGIVLSLFSAIFFALYIVASERLVHVSPLLLVFLCNFSAALLIVIFAQPSLRVSSQNLLLLFLAGSIQLGIPYVLFNTGLKEISAQEASLIVMIEPVLNPLWVALLVREVPPWTTLVGAVFILTPLALRYLCHNDSSHAK